MNKTIIGLIFILAGVSYGSLIIDNFYEHTLGWLVKNGWVKLPPIKSKNIDKTFGPKATILLYSIIMILIGIYILLSN